MEKRPLITKALTAPRKKIVAFQRLMKWLPGDHSKGVKIPDKFLSCGVTTGWFIQMAFREVLKP
jgi:hypothetical protein